MIKGLVSAVIGVVCFIAVTNLTASTILTGTDAGTVLMQTLLGLAVAVGVVIAVLASFLKGHGGS
jgi:hypothetical protein